MGALPFLLGEVPVPVYGTRFTLAMARNRLEELGVVADLREIEPREPFQVGSVFTVEASRVTHTVPDAVGFIVRTPEGTVIHTGDFKLDPDPIDGLRTDLERWGEAGEQGVLCLLSDSTNSEFTQETGSERVVEQTFDRLFREAKGRIIVALFASNLHRVRTVLKLAEQLGRKVALQGRSMTRNVEMARQLGYLDVPESLFVPLDAVPRPGAQPRAAARHRRPGRGARRPGTARRRQRARAARARGHGHPQLPPHPRQRALRGRPAGSAPLDGGPHRLRPGGAGRPRLRPRQPAPAAPRAGHRPSPALRPHPRRAAPPPPPPGHRARVRARSRAAPAGPGRRPASPSRRAGAASPAASPPAASTRTCTAAAW